jgi:hypothetical protein
MKLIIRRHTEQSRIHNAFLRFVSRLTEAQAVTGCLIRRIFCTSLAHKLLLCGSE